MKIENFFKINLKPIKELSEASTAPKDSSKSDLYWMAMNIYHEAGNQPLIGKIAVGVVTLNRLKDKRYPKNIRDVVTEPFQFSWFSHYCHYATTNSLSDFFIRAVS